jgi:fatty-acid desaturase
MNKYFYRIWLPLMSLVIVGTALCLTDNLEMSWTVTLLIWFLIGPLGMGVGFHKLFSHRQFETHSVISKTLAILGTLSAYSPLAISIASHQYHHRHSDNIVDNSSPNYGWFYSLVGYKLVKTIEQHLDFNNKCFKEFLRDKFLIAISKYFTAIIYMYAVALAIMDYNLLFMCFVFPAFIEHLRLGLVGVIGHTNCFGSYRNHNLSDNSHNNWLLGILSFGLAWHNNHHNSPEKIDLRERWYEIDVEGFIAKSLRSRA